MNILEEIVSKKRTRVNEAKSISKNIFFKEQF